MAKQRISNIEVEKVERLDDRTVADIQRLQSQVSSSLPPSAGDAPAGFQWNGKGLASAGAAPVSAAITSDAILAAGNLRFVIISSRTRWPGCAVRHRNGYAAVVKRYKTLAAQSKRLDRQ